MDRSKKKSKKYSKKKENKNMFKLKKPIKIGRRGEPAVAEENILDITLEEAAKYLRLSNSKTQELVDNNIISLDISSVIEFRMYKWHRRERFT